MEKHSKRTKKQFGAGLLALVLLLCAQNIFSQEGQKGWLSREDAEKLSLVPKDGIFFTNKEAQFILQIPQILPSDVQTELPNFPDGVIFNSSKRGDYFAQDGTMGAEIDLWFTFRKTGTITLPPLIIYVKGRRHSIKFQSVEVYENPRTILPRMSLVFDDGQSVGGESDTIPTLFLETGKTARFTIYLQYAIQAQQFAWSIPKDSLFRETKRYKLESQSERPSEFSTKKIQVADFEWTPFAEGTASLPEIRIMATAYSGRSIYLAAPECVVTIAAPKKNAAASAKIGEPQKSGAQKEPVYAYAWTEDTAAKLKEEKKSVSPFDCAEIARLRSSERRAFLNVGKIKADRAAAERAIGIQRSENEPLVFIAFILLGSGGVFLALALTLLALKKRFEAALIGIAAIGIFVITAIDAASILKRRGIIVGGEISPVPEESAMTKTAVTGGSRVLIKEEIQGWYYIVYNESGGWIKKENLAVIK